MYFYGTILLVGIGFKFEPCARAHKAV